MKKLVKITPEVIRFPEAVRLQEAFSLLCEATGGTCGTLKDLACLFTTHISPEDIAVMLPPLNQGRETKLDKRPYYRKFEKRGRK